MKEFQENVGRLISETYNRYNMTIVYVINYLKPFGEKGLPVYGYGENDTHVVDVLRDDCECTRYNINAIRISHRVCPEQILEVHVVKKKQ